MRAWLQALFDLLFPPSCLVCRQPLESRRLPLCCASCLEEIHPITAPWCSRCGAPFLAGGDHLCSRCLREEFAFDLARSACAYSGPLVELLHRFKFQKVLTGLATLAALARESQGFAELAVPDLIIPVPLHPARLRWRGFNQSLLLARALFPGEKERLAPLLLQRIRATPPQSGLRGRERRSNLRKAFALPRPELIEGRSILLIDDVFTTGSSVHECARTLKNGGCGRVEVFTLARSLPRHQTVATPAKNRPIF